MEPVSALLGTVWWLANTALEKLKDDALKDWASSKNLGDNFQKLEQKLLDAQCVLCVAAKMPLDNPALENMLQQLRELAYEAEDVVDELEYFRIQDTLDGTIDAALDPMGDSVCGAISGVTLNARHTVLAAVGNLLSCCSSCLPPPFAMTTEHIPPAPGAVPLPPLAAQPMGNIENQATPLLAPKLEFNRGIMSGRMEELVNRLEQQLAGHVTPGLRLELSNSPLGAKPEIKRPETSSTMVEDEVFGRDEIRDHIINECLTSDKNAYGLSVLPIVGPGGMGKTTLTQYVYGDTKVQENFDIKIWVCVSLNFDVHRLTYEILRCILIAEHEQNMNLNQSDNLDQLQNRIRGKLVSKKFLLVLDDIWVDKFTEGEWKKLIAPLKKGQKKGNVIIVTTRFVSIPQVIRTTNPIELGGLEASHFRRCFLTFVFGDNVAQVIKTTHLIELGSLEASQIWHLFLTCVLGDNFEEELYQDLTNFGEEIIKKLKGSPLAAKTVGRLLRDDLSVDHWRIVLESKEWESQEGDDDIMPALKLSYIYLPSHLQRCFAFCGLFPDDYEFREEELVRFWIGLGILNSNDAGTGVKYIKGLVYHGFFKKEGTNHYVMHDLLRELALMISSHECLSIDCSNAGCIATPPSILHLSMNVKPGQNYDEILKKIKENLKVENLRTLMIFGSYDKNFVHIFEGVFRETKSLRVLHLPKLSNPVESLLYNFSNILHLRYLRFGSNGSSRISLPISVSRFYHLKVIDLMLLIYHLELTRVTL